MNLANIVPENKIEETILMDLNLAYQHGDPISSIKDDLKDEPGAYGYTLDQFNQFLFKYEILN